MNSFRIAAAIAAMACAIIPAHSADLVLRGAKILTMDKAHPQAEALAIEDGKIIAVGSNADIAQHIKAGTEVYDLPGALVLPGFQDTHNHLIWSGTDLQDISLFDLNTKDGLATAIRDGAKKQETEAWVTGGGWSQAPFPNNTLDRKFLDELVPDRPAYFMDADGHSAWVNSKALALAGIDKSTKDPEGGRIERESDGTPQGLLRESAIELVAKLKPPYSKQKIAQGLAQAMGDANAFGITSIIDPAAKDWMLEGYKAALDAGTLTLRVNAAVEVKAAEGTTGLDTVDALRQKYQSDMLRVNSVKLFADGVIETKTAAMIEPYTGTSVSGDLMFTPEQMKAVIIEADKRKLQVHIHAIGDRAVRVSLDGFEAALVANGKGDQRHMITHLEVIDPADIPRFAKLGIIANFQTLWAYPDTYIRELTRPIIGPERSNFLYPVGAVKKAGAMIVASSDWSVSSMNPLEIIQTGVTRQDIADKNGEVLTPEHRVSVDDMLRGYTVDAAYAGFRDKETGVLAPGMLADVVVLDKDITTIASTDIISAKVMLTLLGGKAIYKGEQLPAPAK